MKVTMFKLPRHRVFNHIPIYYNPVKEKQLEREQRIKQEQGHIAPDYSLAGFEQRIRGRMRHHHHQSKFEIFRKERAKSNLRTIIIIGILVILAFYLLFSSNEWLELVKK